MNKSVSLIVLSVLIISVLVSCKDKKESPMVDMDTIKTDGSHDDRYIFQKEIEKEEMRGKKYKKNNF
ncbi:MAG TPA: hypothetical protein PKG60_09435 [Spirochaetota bacterium]|nr:hypothetical protein [Spirochaetota bacterium]HPS87743.1 hypothetical protein [Spirochaetota bacterium]